MRARFPLFMPRFCFGLLASLTLVSTAAAQGIFKDQLGLQGNRRGAASLAEFSTQLVPSTDKPREEVVLQITAKIPPDNYIYSTNPGNGAETKISLSKINGLAVIDSTFQSFPAPKQVKEDVLENDKLVEKAVEKHFSHVTWTRRFRILPNTNPADIGIDGTVKYQICDTTTCRPNNKFEFSVKLTADAALESRPATSTDGPVLSLPSDGLPLTFEHRKGFKNDGPTISRWTVAIQPRQARPGDTVTFSIASALEPGWHVFALDQVQNADGTGSLNTAIVLREHGPLVPQGTGFTAPAPHTKVSDAFEGLIEKYYEGSVRWERQFKIPDNATSGKQNITGDVAFQTCNKGECIVSGFSFVGQVTIAETAAPEPLIFAGTGPMKPGQAQEVMEEARAAPAPPNAVSRSGNATAPASTNGTTRVAGRDATRPAATEQAANDAAAGIQNQGLFLFLLTAVGAGFAALLTPCVFPMVPITVSFFQKQSEKQHHRPVTMAAVYCVGIIGTFTGLGMLMSILFGAASPNTLANNPWINLFIAGILIFFGFNLLGMFEIRIPSWLLTYAAGQESRGGFIGVLFMALTFTLTSFTCTFAFAGGLLSLAAKGDRLWPILGLLAFSAAFSMPFFFLALFPSLLKKLPKSGGWMNTIKVIMGLIELGAAFKFLATADQSWNPIPVLFDYEMVMTGWMVTSIIAGFYLLGLFRLPHDVSADHIGVVRLMFASTFFGLAAYISVGLFSASEPKGALYATIRSLAPLRLNVINDSFGPAVEHDGILYALDYQKAIEYAERHNKPVFLDFTGVNCANCRLMEQTVLNRPEIIERLKKFVCIQVYADQVPVGDAADRERILESNLKLQEWYGDNALPSYAVVPGDRNITADAGNILSRVSGYNKDEQRFAKFLDDGLAAWQVKTARKNGAALLGSR